MKPFIVGIAGGSGSGKTTLAKKIVQLLNSKDVILMSIDNYYKDLSHLPRSKRKEVNFDHPDSIDWVLLREHLSDLLKGKSIDVPSYSFKDNTRSNKTTKVKPAKVIIFEGIFALYDDFCNKHYNLKIFIETDADLRFIRRIKRDQKERGDNHDDVITMWLSNVKPMHELYIEPSKKFAHIILPEHQRDVSVDLIVKGIKGIVKL